MRPEPQDPLERATRNLTLAGRVLNWAVLMLLLAAVVRLVHAMVELRAGP